MQISNVIALYYNCDHGSLGNSLEFPFISLVLIFATFRCIWIVSIRFFINPFLHWFHSWWWNLVRRWFFQFFYENIAFFVVNDISFCGIFVYVLLSPYALLYPLNPYEQWVKVWSHVLVEILNHENHYLVYYICWYHYVIHYTLTVVCVTPSL